MGYDDVLAALDAVRRALEADDAGSVDAALDRLNEAYTTVKTAERSRVARLQAARNASELTREQNDALGTYERWFMTTHFGRGALLGGGELYLLDPDEADPAELADQAAALVDRERGLRDATGDAVDVLGEVTVPPRLGVLSFSATGESPVLGDPVGLDLVVENVGDEPATGVEATVSADALGAEKSRTLGDLGPGTRRTLSFEFAASTGGTVEFDATVSSADAGTVTETATVVVRTKTSILETVVETLRELKERVQSANGKKGKVRSVTSKIDAAIQSMNRALSEIEAGREKQANNAIRTGANQLGALLNSLAGSGGRGSGGGNALPSALRATLSNRVELAIDHLADARRTGIAS